MNPFTQIKQLLTSLNITALTASGFVVIPKMFENKSTGETNPQHDDFPSLLAQLQPLLPPGYKAEIPEPTRKYPDESILIGVDSSITDYAFDNINQPR